MQTSELKYTQAQLDAAAAEERERCDARAALAALDGGGDRG